LDIILPDIDGWRVLDRLKNDVSTRHIPVAVMSTEEAKPRAYRMGAVDFAAKPMHTRDDLASFIERVKAFVERPDRRLLAVGAPSAQLAAALKSLEVEGVQALGMHSGEEAVELLAAEQFDCIVVDPTEDAVELELLAELLDRTSDRRPAGVVVRRCNGLPDRAAAALRRLEANAPVRFAATDESLLDHAALLLHLPVERLPAEQRNRLQSVEQNPEILQGKKVLIVDDDIRNIFALSSILEWQGMEIYSAETGRDAIEILDSTPDVDVVLMDIMMPEMDGYQTIAAIRQIPKFKSLPIIAVTAKAMKGDREKCIEAGAWDYLSKPVDPQQLLAVLRAWVLR
jgi:CheY-like chemotaxis protein